MTVAVLLSSYNGEKYLEQQLESLLAQTVEARIFVRDDGSTDGTHAILERYAAAGKLSWYTGRNLRSAKSFLHLVQNTQDFDAYAFCDQDDIWYPDKLERALDKLSQQTGPALYFADARLVDGAGEDLGRTVYRHRPKYDFYSLVCAPNVLGCTCVFNEALAKLLRAAQPAHLIMHDCWAAAVCALGGGTVLYDPRACMDYRQHGSNVVGVSRSKLAAVRDRLRRITKAEPVSIAQQAQSLLDAFPDTACTDFLCRVSRYRESVFRALGLAVSGKYHCASFNMALTVRLATLLRKR